MVRVNAACTVKFSRVFLSILFIEPKWHNLKVTHFIHAAWETLENAFIWVNNIEIQRVPGAVLGLEIQVHISSEDQNRCERLFEFFIFLVTASSNLLFSLNRGMGDSVGRRGYFIFPPTVLLFVCSKSWWEVFGINSNILFICFHIFST